MIFDNEEHEKDLANKKKTLDLILEGLYPFLKDFEVQLGYTYENKRLFSQSLLDPSLYQYLE